MRLVSTTFDEGRLFDLWMAVHFLAGVAGGFSNVFFGLSTPWVFAVGIGLMIAWELVEYAAGVREGAVNRVLDVIVGTAGVALALAIAAPFGMRARLAFFVLSVAACGTGSGLGWRAYRRRRAPSNGPSGAA